jgi:hypothetical protein
MKAEPDALAIHDDPVSELRASGGWTSANTANRTIAKPLSRQKLARGLGMHPPDASCAHALNGAIGVRVPDRRNQILCCSIKSALKRSAEDDMNSIIYIIGLIVVVLAILSFLGLR